MKTIDKYSILYKFLKTKGIRLRTFFIYTAQSYYRTDLQRGCSVEDFLYLLDSHFSELFVYAFEWCETIEGNTYWLRINEEWVDFYYFYYTSRITHHRIKARKT